MHKTCILILHIFCALPGERIGFESVLPYLSPELTGQKLLNGANFASAGIGVLNDTGIQFVSLLPPKLIL